jgi:hypothetical protein
MMSQLDTMDESAELEAAERVVMRWHSSPASTTAAGRDDELMLFDGTGDQAEAECSLRAPFFILPQKTTSGLFVFLKKH